MHFKIEAILIAAFALATTVLAVPGPLAALAASDCSNESCSYDIDCPQSKFIIFHIEGQSF
jgi:hypothetical protein